MGSEKPQMESKKKFEGKENEKKEICLFFFVLSYALHLKGTQERKERMHEGHNFAVECFKKMGNLVKIFLKSSLRDGRCCCLILLYFSITIVALKKETRKLKEEC